MHAYGAMFASPSAAALLSSRLGVPPSCQGGAASFAPAGCFQIALASTLLLLATPDLAVGPLAHCLARAAFAGEGGVAGHVWLIFPLK